MTSDKFKSIVAAVISSKEPHLSSFGTADLNALARDYSSGKADISAAIERLEALYKETDTIDRHDFAEIEKRLQRA
ncbi:MAG: hypothetical protein WAV46_04395 [Candidatus Moraniibacteriota bacterium]